jgi:hypothetical protein
MKNKAEKGEKTRILSAGGKKHEDEKQANISTRTSDKSSTVLNKKEKRKKQQKSNLLEFTLQDTNSVSVRLLFTFICHV